MPDAELRRRLEQEITMSVRHCIATAIAFIAILTPSIRANAYEEDTHYLITYIVCRAVGFTHDEALTVAAVDQGMDDSPATVANFGEAGILPAPEEEWMWHALDRDG